MRRRTCRTCHGPATWEEVRTHNLTHVTLDGRITLHPTTTSVYYCDSHTGMTATIESKETA